MRARRPHGRLVEITGAGINQNNAYDASGLRVVRNGRSGTTVFASQHFELRNGQQATKHIFAGSVRVASVMTKFASAQPPGQGGTPSGQAKKGQGETGGTDPPIADTPGTAFYFHQDHLSSTAVLTDEYGEVQEHTGYFPDGATWYERGARRPINGYLFSGKPLDPDSGLYDFGQRFYDPDTSLWLGLDPAFTDRTSDAIGKPMMLASLAYAGQSPLRFVDPNGRIFFDVITGMYEVEAGDTRQSMASDLGITLSPIQNVQARVLDVVSPLVVGTQKARTGKSNRLDNLERSFRHVGSDDYAFSASIGRFAANTNKCNKFCGDQAAEGGVDVTRNVPGTSRRRMYVASEYADAGRVIDGTQVIPGGDANAKPGDILAVNRSAIYSDATGHVLIFAGNVGVRDSSGILHARTPGVPNVITPDADAVNYTTLERKRRRTDPAEGFTVRRLTE